jgi:hypothetical protein
MSRLSFPEEAFDYLFLIISIVALQDEEIFFFFTKMDKTIFKSICNHVDYSQLF